MTAGKPSIVLLVSPLPVILPSVAALGCESADGDLVAIWLRSAFDLPAIRLQSRGQARKPWKPYPKGDRQQRPLDTVATDLPRQFARRGLANRSGSREALPGLLKIRSGFYRGMVPTDEGFWTTDSWRMLAQEEQILDESAEGKSLTPFFVPFTTMAIDGHSPAQPVLGPCFSTGRQAAAPPPPPRRRSAVFGGGRTARRTISRSRSVYLPVLKHGPNTGCAGNERKRPCTARGEQK